MLKNFASFKTNIALGETLNFQNLCDHEKNKYLLICINGGLDGYYKVRTTS